MPQLELNISADREVICEKFVVKKKKVNSGLKQILQVHKSFIKNCRTQTEM